MVSIFKMLTKEFIVNKIIYFFLISKEENIWIIKEFNKSWESKFDQFQDERIWKGVWASRSYSLRIKWNKKWLKIQVKWGYKQEAKLKDWALKES